MNFCSEILPNILYYIEFCSIIIRISKIGVCK